jgi:hypothetical protein
VNAAVSIACSGRRRSVGLPQYLQQQRGDHRIDVHAVDVARDAGVEQRLHQRPVVVVEDVVLAALLEELADEHFAGIEVDGPVLEHRVIDAGNLLDVEAPRRLLRVL